MKNLIPHFIAEKYSNNEFEGKLQAVTMFLDISGFTPMTEELMKQGKEGAEILSKIINNVFEPIIDLVYKSGGFISSFAGDAFTSIYTNYDDPLQIVSCALEINNVLKKIGRQKNKYGEFELFVKLGLSYGMVEYGIIGNKGNRTYFFKGEAIDSCAHSEQQCDKMEIIIDKAILDLIDISELQLKKIDDKYYKLITLMSDENDIYKIYNEREQTISKEILAEFMPEKVIELNQQGEFREIVSVFISLKGNDHMNEIVKNISEETKIYGGFFNRVDYGDKGCSILVFFGAPTSYENNTLRAANFIQSIKEQHSEFIRAGITEGIAYAGFIGSDRRCEYTCFGDVVNLSARFMMKANYGEVWLTEEASQKLIGKYELDDLGRLSFKGKSKEIQVYCLKNKIKNIDSVFFTGEMVGREKEMDLMKNFSKPLEEGNFAGTVIIYGEAGMGKSRLVYEFVKYHTELVEVLLMQTDNILKSSMNPFKYFMNNYFEQAKPETVEEKKDRFEVIYNKLLSELSELDDNRKLSIIKELKRTRSILSSQIEIFYENSLYEQLDPKGRYENTIFAYKELFKALSLIKPVIIQIEDIHWLDEDSHKVFNTLCRNIEDYPIMIIATSRFNDDHSKPIIKIDKEIKQEEIILDKLEESAADSFIELQLKGKAEQQLSDLIKTKTEFNPFYIEQFINYLRENELLLLEDNAYKISRIDYEIPSNINAIIIARIDRLESDIKNIVQIASVLGREVELKLLNELIELYQQTSENISRYLDEIEEQHLWIKLEEIKYIFKHALLHEAVYEMQLKTRLRELHYLAAKSLINIYGDSEEKYYEIADHYDKAENREKSIEYLEKYGEYAKKNYYNHKAIEIYDKLLKLISETDDYDKYCKFLSSKASILYHIGNLDEAYQCHEKKLSIVKENNNKKLEIDAKISLGDILLIKGEMSKAIEFFKYAQSLSIEIDYHLGINNALINIAKYYDYKGDYDISIEYANKYLDLSRKIENKKCIAEGLNFIGNIYYKKRIFKKAMNYYDEALLILKELDNKIVIKNYYINIGNIYYFFGEYDKAIKYYNEYLSISQDMGDLCAIARAFCNLGLTYFMLDASYETALDYFNKYLTISKNRGDLNDIAAAAGNIGLIYNELGEYSEAMKYYKWDLNISEKQGYKTGIIRAVSNVGRVHLELGNFTEALEYFEKYKQYSIELELRRSYSTSLHNIGMVYEKQGKYDAALTCYNEAIIIADELGIKNDLYYYLLLKAKLLLNIGKKDGVKDILQKIEILYREMYGQELSTLHLKSYNKKQFF